MALRQQQLLLSAIVLSIMLVGHTQEVEELGNKDAPLAQHAPGGIDGIRQLLRTVRKSPETRHKLVSLGDSLATAETNLPQIHAFAHKLMKNFMSDATSASSTGSRTGTQFDALVASIARQLQNGDENKIAMLQGLVKEAVQAEVLRKGGRSGEVEDMEIPDEAAGTEDTSDKMDKEAADNVDQQVSKEMSRRQNLRAAARTLEIQKAKDKEKNAQAKVDQLTKDEEEQKKKVAQFTLEEEKLREEAAQAHAAATSRDLSAKIAREASNEATRQAKRVTEEEAEVDKIKVEARESLTTTMQKDHQAKEAQQNMVTSEEQLETAHDSTDALQKVAQSSMDKIHKRLAKLIVHLNTAKEEQGVAERKLRNAEKAAAEATEPSEKQAAEAGLAAAQAAASQAKAQVEMDEKEKQTATTLAGSKKMKESLSIAAAEANLKSTKLKVNDMQLATKKAEQDAADAQQHASKMSITSTAAMEKLKLHRAEAQAAAQKAMEARRMESPTVANEVATKKAIAVASTNFVKRQAAAKVLMIQKKKKAALEELSVIRVVAARLAAESPANQEGDETQEAEEAPDKVEPIGSP